MPRPMSWLIFRRWGWRKKQILWDPAEVIRRLTALIEDGYSADELLLYLDLSRVCQEGEEGL